MLNGYVFFKNVHPSLTILMFFKYTEKNIKSILVELKIQEGSREINPPKMCGLRRVRGSS